MKNRTRFSPQAEGLEARSLMNGDFSAPTVDTAEYYQYEQSKAFEEAQASAFDYLSNISRYTISDMSPTDQYNVNILTSGLLKPVVSSETQPVSVSEVPLTSVGSSTSFEPYDFSADPSVSLRNDFISGSSSNYLPIVQDRFLIEEQNRSADELLGTTSPRTPTE